MNILRAGTRSRKHGAAVEIKILGQQQHRPNTDQHADDPAQQVQDPIAPAMITK